MKALVKTRSGAGFLQLMEVERPEPEPGEVLLRVKAAGICGSDLHIKDDRLPNNPPVILGHEFSGEVVALGEKVSGFSVADRVVSEPHKGGCGHCRYCMNAQVEICPQKKAIGYKIDGCFSEYICMPASSLHRIPNHLSFETAALTEPLAVGVKALLERSRVEAEDLVVVLGSGPVGLLAAAAAKAGGAKSVVVAGTDLDLEVRLPIAREMGLDYAVSVQQADLKDLVSELTDGVGADLVVEASGAPAAINQAFELVRRDGRICGIGLASSDRVAVSWNQGLLKSVTISFSVSTSWTSWERALSLLATGRVDVAPIISGSYPLDDFEEAFSTLENLKAVKNLFLP